MNATTHHDPASRVRVDAETIDRLRAARREYGEQCPAAHKLRALLPADSRESRRSFARLAEEQSLAAARTGRTAAPVEVTVTEDDLTPIQRAELEHAGSRATTSMVLGIIGIVLFGILALVAVPIGHKSRRTLSRYPLLRARYGWTRATVGVVLGWIVIGGWVVLWLVMAITRWAIWNLFT